MLKKTIFTLMLPFVAACGLKAQQVQNFVITPQKAIAGKLVSIAYNPKSTPLEGKKKITATLYTFRNYNWETAEVGLTKKDSLWTFDFVPEKDAALIAFKFKSGKKTDIGNAYGWMLQDSTGSNLPGAYAGWAFLRNPTIKEMYPGYTDGKALIGDDVVSYWMTQQFRALPQSKRHILYYALKVLKKTDPEKARIEAFGDIKYVNNLPDLNMKDLQNLQKIYAEILEQPVSADSVGKIIASIDSSAIRSRNADKLVAYRAITKDQDYKKVLGNYIDFLKNYPLNRADHVFDAANYIDYGRIYGSIGTLASVVKDTVLYKKYVAEAPFSSLSTIYYRAVQVPYVSLKAIQAAEAYVYAKPIINRMMEFNPWKPEQFMDVYFDLIPVFSDILMHVNKDEPALGFATSAQQKYQYGLSTLNEVQAILLERMGQKDKLRMVLEASAKKNQMSPEMLTMFKKIYIEDHKNEEGFDAYVYSLKGDEVKKELEETVKKAMISKVVPDFNLKDNHGKMVRLSAQKGKVVVLDFWASWCAPCKAAFPGMNMVKNRYAKDNDVVFFFIDTQEKMKDYEGYVKKYLADKGFDFNVLFDADAKMSKAFGVGPIPHKMVIGKDGKLRFSEVGYMGSPSELADEIGMMIEIARSAK